MPLPNILIENENALCYKYKPQLEKVYKTGDVVYWPDRVYVGDIYGNVKAHWLRRVCCGFVCQQFFGECTVDPLVRKDVRTINGIPYREFEQQCPTKWQKLPKDWKPDTALFEIHEPLTYKFPEIDFTSPKAVCEAFEKGELILGKDLCPELYFIQEISSNGWRIDARYKETVPNVIKRLCDTISLPTAHFYSTYAEAQRELDDELAEYQRQANLSDYEWALEDLNKVLAHWAKLYGHTEDECENIRRRLLTLKKFEELEFCLMSSNVGYKYFKNSKWNAIYPVPNYKGELVYDNMSM